MTSLQSNLDDSESSLRLSYPSLRVDDSISSIVQDSLKMRLAAHFPTPQGRESPNRLEEGEYEVVNESTFLVSEDEDNYTESLASVDGHTQDDISSIADTDTEESREGEGSEGQPLGTPADPGVSQVIPAFEPFMAGSSKTMNDSELTSRTTPRSVSSSIVFAEPTEPLKGEDIPVSHMVGPFDETHMPENLRGYRRPHIALSIKGALSPYPLSLDRPFRVLYVSEGGDWAKEQIIGKLGSALAAKANEGSNHGSARYNIVPISSFGDKNSSPEVALTDSWGIELIVDDCTDAVDRSGPQEEDLRVEITLNDERHLLLGPRERIEVLNDPSQTPQLPDLAVFFHSAHDDSSNEPIWPLYVRYAMRTHAVPLLDISFPPLASRSPKYFDGAFDSKNLHMCVEAPGPCDEPPHILETLPVPLDIFVDIDSRQLNRHLACVTGLRHVPKQGTIKVPSQGFQFNSPMCSAIASTFNELWMDQFFRRLAIFAMFLLVSLPFCFVLPSSAPARSGNMIGLRESQNTALSSALPTNSSSTGATPIPAASKPIPVNPAPSHDPSSKALSLGNLNKALGQPMMHPLSPRANESDEFKVHVVGDYHFVLTPPRRFASLKKPPQLFITASRGSEALEAKLSKLVEGVYVVEISREQAHGIVDVKIWTKSKPLVSQSFKVNLGSPWLKMSTWAGAAGKLSGSLQMDLAVIQSGFSNVTSLVAETLQSTMDTFYSNAESVCYRASDSAKESRRRVKKTVRRVTKQTKEAAESARHLRDTVAQSLAGVQDGISRVWKDTASIRKSPSILKARKNAQRLWAKTRRRVDKKKAKGARKERCGRRCSKKRHGAARGRR